MFVNLRKCSQATSLSVLWLLCAVGCSDGAADGGSTEGESGTGGSDLGSGGAATGGTSTGGMATGGATGGVGTGGAGTGGSTGGAGTGGVGGATGGTGTGGATGGAGTGGDGSGGTAVGGEFTLTSSALMDMGTFAEINTCAGGEGAMGFGEAIPLEWSGFPEGTMSFALTMIDVTLVDGDANYLGCHSALWNLPVTTTSLPSVDWSSALGGAMSIRDGYLGPCPNFGGGTNEDTYVFTLYAMGDATLSDPDINAQAFGNIDDCNAMRDALDAAALESVTLTGVSSAVGGL